VTLGMGVVLDKTISALAYELAALHGGPPSETYPNYNDISRFVTEQLDRMPTFLGLAIKTATLAFSASRLLVDGTFFHRRESLRRKAQVEAWKRSKFSPCRDLMKFHSSLVVLALYSRPDADRSREEVG
jgi:hypothetical protein